MALLSFHEMTAVFIFFMGHFLAFIGRPLTCRLTSLTETPVGLGPTSPAVLCHRLFSARVGE